MGRMKDLYTEAMTGGDEDDVDPTPEQGDQSSL